MTRVIGIDLGTTMSAMAYVDEVGRPVIIPNAEGEKLTPSCIMIRGDERPIGRRAKNAAIALPKNVFQFVKRQMSDPKCVFTDDSGKQHRPEELSALILKKLKQDAEKHLGDTVTQAVITVPAYFRDLERQRTKQAGEIAGFEVLDIINEPTAAAIAYGIRQAQQDMTILVYDLGGGTFDVTIMQVLGGGELKVLTSCGDHSLGGVDFDEAVCKFCAEQFKAKHQIDPLENLKTYQDLRTKAEAAKIDLSTDVKTEISLTAEGHVLDIEFTRAEFEKLIAFYVDQTQVLTEGVLSDASLDWGHVDRVLLVGGSTRIPVVQNMVKSLTGKEPEMGVNPDEVVAMGAAVYAATLSGVPVRDTGGRAMAAIKVRNVTAHSLGIIAQNDAGKDFNAKLIEKNSEIPAVGEGIFTTVADNQTEVRIQIVQGEDENPTYCTNVGNAGLLQGIPPQPKGKPQIKVWLSYDKAGIVHLRATDLASSSELVADIENNALLSKEEVKRAAKDVASLKVT
jgi:molecular chaperone DnaK